MKNSELEKLLKSARVPERPAEYWDKFPARVMAKTHWLASREGTAAQERAAGVFGLRPSWRLAIVGVGLLVIAGLVGYNFGLGRGRSLSISAVQMAAARKYYQEVEALFPGQVQSIVFGQQGPRLVLADKPDVPPSVPLYLRIRGPKGFQNFVTFSGQQIRLDGEVCDVLLDPQGKVLLAGPEWVVSTGNAPMKHARYQVAARPLEATL